MIDDKVRAWVMQKRPGLVEAASPQAAFLKAWGMSGIACSAGEFTDALVRAGFRVDQVRTTYRLALPAWSVGETRR